MKAEYINAFIGASRSVLQTITGHTYKMGRPTTEKSPLKADSVIILLGITGDIKGQATLSMTDSTARGIASKMMMGMSIETLDEMSKSALSEMGNMIMGNSATLLANEGAKIDITPPTLMVGSGMVMSVSGMQTIGLPLHSDLGDIHFTISIKS